ncbi:4-hydroxyphenylpyruvate dioxygenase [Actinoplanes sp. G11-F43]|uniref:4-hydroxyphenylpyruvate dioxygenase n=1 Tax=Actinoplanes sp. G11-F43 TaxID=3424130 RepID=UPI003D33550D
MNGHPPIHGIAHCDIAVGNVDTAAETLRREYGFTDQADVAVRTCADERTLMLGQGAIRLTVSGATRPGAPAGTFVHQHGEGVRDIGLLVPDPDEAQRLAVARGGRATDRTPAWAPAGSRSIEGPGVFTHTFVAAGEPRGEDPAGPLRLLDHFALAVACGDLESWADFYVTVLGFEVVMKETTDTGRTSMRSIVVRHPGSRITFTIVEPGAPGDRSQINEFVAANGGAGVQHIAMLTGDIADTVDRLREAGVTFLTTPATYYERLHDRVPNLPDPIERLRSRHILVDSDAGGELLQIFTRPVTGRPTLFFEVIERRHGSSGFGSGNIKALFEAVEADQAGRGVL